MNVRQHELFDRHQAPKVLRPDTKNYVLRKPKPRTKSLTWEGMGSWARHIGHLLAVETFSSDHYQRFQTTARTLTVEKIRTCRHVEDLERVEKMLDRRVSINLHNLDRVWSKRERGELLVETRNRIAQLRLGRETPKPKGPRFDVATLPIDAIERLIQSHSDMTIVEQLRAERERRRAA